MKVNEMTLRSCVNHCRDEILMCDQYDNVICSVAWVKGFRTRVQALAIAKRLCDRFNEGQQK